MYYNTIYMTDRLQGITAEVKSLEEKVKALTAELKQYKKMLKERMTDLFNCIEENKC